MFDAKMRDDWDRRIITIGRGVNKITFSMYPTKYQGQTQDYDVMKLQMLLMTLMMSFQIILKKKYLLLRFLVKESITYLKIKVLLIMKF